MSEAADEKVKLETREGGHVGWTRIPRFRPCADVLLWGARIFRYRDISTQDGGHLLYREALIYSLRGQVERPPPAAPPAAPAAENR